MSLLAAFALAIVSRRAADDFGELVAGVSCAVPVWRCCSDFELVLLSGLALAFETVGFEPPTDGKGLVSRDGSAGFLKIDEMEGLCAVV